jgi:hypothetical protein
MGLPILTGVGLAAADALAPVLISALNSSSRGISVPAQNVQSPSGATAQIPQTIIIPDVAIEERHKDELEITQVPVELGVPISDHVYKKPAEVVMRMAWSTSKSLSTLIGSVFSGHMPTSIQDVYQQLLKLQHVTSTPPMIPCTVYTGKRVYQNMLLRSLQVVTDHDSENALMVEAIFQEVIFAQTQVQSASTLLGTPQNQAQPQNTASPISSGVKQLGQAVQSAATTIGGMI